MLLAAGSVAVAVAYVAVDVTPYHVWHVAQLPAAADGGRVTPPETSTVDPEPEMPPTTEPSTPTQTSAEAALAQPAPADPGPAQPLTFASAGGAIVADCHDDRAYLQSWTPTEGFKVKKLDPGPGSSAWVELRNTNVSIVMTVTCASGIPTVAIDA
jgi:hypothetical protein